MFLQPLRILYRWIRKGCDDTRKAVRRLQFNMVRPSIVRRFHKLYYRGSEHGITWGDTRWLNTEVLKCPLDLWLYQEIICQVRPDLIVETGTYKGGSALFLASLCDLLHHGEIVTVDRTLHEGLPEHKRITYITGSSIDDDIVSRIREMTAGATTVMVILDSAHQKAHVEAELRLYSPLVTPGSYLIVEDTHLNGNPIRPDYGAGPKEAVDGFLRGNPSFSVDSIGSKLLMSFNPGGFLRRTVKPP